MTVYGLDAREITHLHQQRMKAIRFGAGHIKALRAPANRSKLVAFEFLVLHAVGRNEWNRAIAAPVNLDVYADERAYQAEAWRAAMAKMQDFYQQAAKRKGIVL